MTSHQTASDIDITAYDSEDTKVHNPWRYILSCIVIIIILYATYRVCVPKNQKLHGNLCMRCTCLWGSIRKFGKDSAVNLRVALALIYIEV